MGDTVRCPCREWEDKRDLMGGRILRYRHADGHYSIIPLDDGEHLFCYFCGARFTVGEDGAVSVGKSGAELEAENERLLTVQKAIYRWGSEQEQLVGRIAKLEAKLQAELDAEREVALMLAGQMGDESAYPHEWSPEQIVDDAMRAVLSKQAAKGENDG